MDTDSSNIWWKIFWRIVTVFHYTPVHAKQFDGLNIEGVAGKHQKCQNFPCQNFALYSILLCSVLLHMLFPVVYGAGKQGTRWNVFYLMSEVAARNGHPILLSFKDMMSLIREVYPLHNLCGCIPNWIYKGDYKTQNSGISKFQLTIFQYRMLCYIILHVASIVKTLACTLIVCFQ